MSFITLIILTVSVFLIIFLVRLMKLSKEAEKTLVLVNDRLPQSLDELHSLINHTEKSLDELDRTLTSIAVPVETFSHAVSSAKNMMSGVLSAKSHRNTKHNDPDDFGMGFASFIGTHISKIAISALSGGIIAFVSRMIVKRSKAEH